MKKLIRRLSRVADSSQYCLLRFETRTLARAYQTESFRSGKFRRSKLRSGTVPEGHLPVKLVNYRSQTHEYMCHRDARSSCVYALQELLSMH
ncbi:hypothetical protein ACSBR1_028206 [Camellia fascicularis]